MSIIPTVLPTENARQHRREHLAKAQSVVIKIGTAVLTDRDGRLDEGRIAALAGQVAAIGRGGPSGRRSVVLVSSGAVGAGVGRLNLPGRPSELPALQAAAAVGQPLLMRAWEAGFAPLGLPTAQILLTRADFAERTSYLNLCETLRALADLGAVPILNENDTVAVEELRFTDNDGLASLTASLVAADVLVLLSSVEGLLAPGVDGSPKPLDVVARIGPEIEALIRPEKSRLGKGGMATKLDSVARTTAGGTAVVIADGRREGVLERLLAGETEGTLFLPTGERDQARRRWIAQAAHPAGRVLLDAGAAAAVAAGKSLLPSGVTGIIGRFERGDVVCVVGPEGTEIARGLVNYSAEEAQKIRGLRSDRIAAVLGSRPYDELIHRDYLVLC